MKSYEHMLSEREGQSQLLLHAIRQYEMQSYTGALATVQKFLLADPGSFSAHLLACGALTELGCYTEALHAYHRLLQDAPPCARAAIAVSIGQILEMQQQYAEALLAYNEATVFDEEFGIAWASQGDMFLHFCRYEDTLASYDRACALEHGDALLHAHRGKALAVLGQFEQARAAFSSARELEEQCICLQRRGEGNGLY